MRQSQFVPCCCANTAASVAWQLYGSTAENGVWVLPRSHRIGQIDIGALVKQHGDRIPGRQPTQPRLLDESKRFDESNYDLCRIRADGVSTRRRCHCQPQLPAVRLIILHY